MQSLIHGFLVSGGLIVAIGAQNAFVLKQGLLKQHVFAVALICFLCDVILFNLGVLGLGSFISEHQMASITLAFVGAGFLFIYALRAWRSAYRGNSSLQISTENSQQHLLKTILMTLSITLLNPHVYLDTVVIIGGVAGTLALSEKIWFLLGAVLASGSWFFGLAYGSALLIPLFKKPITWRILDFVIGIIMLMIAWGLYQYGMGLLAS
ncbi:amino acid transporter [Gallibacterium salpingitidis]|uniref:Amino acid transporter n=1 Tax=Gallibacterium salpingitidis TaxID=505341 RepID=A0AB36E446_9PAST|nr:LysE/ArgO family amino acid transporter [Gallibacterium salpingitidis]OBX06505.1 amino acid transporter [Gallibacterium salpingitidis]OBX08868.1 amino acid transporter [Gallibacterium salpingitidis]WKS99449.1 LysE/ArgO family amino acid transporter [Gallibacterium salpingitidis]